MGRRLRGCRGTHPTSRKGGEKWGTQFSQGPSTPQISAFAMIGCGRDDRVGVMDETVGGWGI
jgi:hypothetical protein